MKKVLQILLITSIFICFFIFLRATDISESIHLIGQLGFYSVFILITTFFAYLFGALGWSFCIDSDIKPSVKQLFIIRHIGNTITLFNPTSAIAGEVFNARALMDEGVKEINAYKSVLLSRMLMVLSQLILLIVVLIWLIFFLSDILPCEIIPLIYISFVFIITAILSLAFLLLKKGSEMSTAPKSKKWYKIINRIKEMRFLLAEYIRRRPKETLIAFFFFSIHWFLGSLELFFILYFLNFSVDIWDGLFLDTLIIVLKSTVSFIPGQLGIEELINKFVLHLVGISSPNLWLSVSILRRSRQLFWSGVALFLYFQLKRRNKLINKYGDIVREP